MLVDPTQTAVDRHTPRVQRGCGFFTGRHAGRTDTGGWSATRTALDEAAVRGFRLSLTLPCTSVRGVVE